MFSHLRTKSCFRTYQNPVLTNVKNFFLAPKYRILFSCLDRRILFSLDVKRANKQSCDTCSRRLDVRDHANKLSLKWTGKEVLPQFYCETIHILCSGLFRDNLNVMFLTISRQLKCYVPNYFETTRMIMHELFLDN